MLLDILTDNLANIFRQKVSLKELTEIRIRRNKPIVVFVKGQPYYLSNNGLCCDIDEALVASQDMIN